MVTLPVIHSEKVTEEEKSKLAHVVEFVQPKKKCMKYFGKETAFCLYCLPVQQWFNPLPDDKF